MCVKTLHTIIALKRVFTHITHANIVVTYVNTLFACVIKNWKMQKFNYNLIYMIHINTIAKSLKWENTIMSTKDWCLKDKENLNKFRTKYEFICYKFLFTWFKFSLKFCPFKLLRAKQPRKFDKTDTFYRQAGDSIRDRWLCEARQGV